MVCATLKQRLFHLQGMPTACIPMEEQTVEVKGVKDLGFLIELPFFL